MNPDDALVRIAEIHGLMSRGRMFRGYRSTTTAFTGALALAAAGVQAWLLPRPGEQAAAFLALWGAVAALSIGLVGSVIAWRYWRTDSDLDRGLTAAALGQFVPVVVIGGLLTGLLTCFAPQTLWLLPGLWSLFFALAVFASRQVLPRATRWVGAHYVLAGALALSAGQGEQALAPWTMALSFGAGQLLSAGVLYWTLERRHAPSP